MEALATATILSLLWFGAVAHAQMPPTQVIETLAEQMIQALRDNRERLAQDPRRVRALVETIAIPHIDVDFFSRYVLGHQWRDATPGQRKRFQAAFKTYVVDSYANVLLKYRDQTVQVLPLSRGDRGRSVVTVRSKIKGGGAQPVSVDYRLHQSRKGWRICDIAVQGVSLGISYRHSFAEEASRKGLDALIADLERHNAEQAAVLDP